MRKDLSDFISAVKALHWKGLFTKPTENPVTQFFRYKFCRRAFRLPLTRNFYALYARGLHYLTAAALLLRGHRVQLSPFEAAGISGGAGPGGIPRNHRLCAHRLTGLALTEFLCICSQPALHSFHGL